MAAIIIAWAVILSISYSLRVWILYQAAWVQMPILAFIS